LGIKYKKIHSCKNDCILYRNEYQDNVECHVCKDKRYHPYVKGPIFPKKVLHHMPFIHILQWMFCFKSLAQLMEWNENNRSNYGFMWIIANSKALKHIEEKWPTIFKDEPCSIRFGLAIGCLSCAFYCWDATDMDRHKNVWNITTSIK